MNDHQLETTCDRCGARHRVVESMPNRPFTAEDLARLDRSCAFVGAVGATTDDGTERPAVRTASDESATLAATADGTSAETTTNTLVVSTSRATRLLRRADDHGWVVDRERPHDDEMSPAAAGLDLYAEATPDARLPVADARTVLALGR